MFKIIYDPTNHWTEKGIPTSRFVSVCRVPVMWATNDDWHKTLLERIKSMYSFGWIPMEGFEHDVITGVMYYPGDPPFHPLVYVQNGPDEAGDHFLFYNHDLISIFNTETQKYETSRID